jgi:Asp-tRNA(Asn)/Glu-tRNA(Gln) amidotransferase A subunit family amidase
MKKSELEKIIKEELAKMKKAKPMKEQEETALSSGTEKLVQDAVKALKETNGVKIDENLISEISDDTAQLAMQIIVGAYGTAVALGVGNLIKIALTSPKEEVDAAFKKIASQVRQQGRDRGF